MFGLLSACLIVNAVFWGLDFEVVEGMLGLFFRQIEYYLVVLAV